MQNCRKVCLELLDKFRISCWGHVRSCEGPFLRNYEPPVHGLRSSLITVQTRIHDDG